MRSRTARQLAQVAEARIERDLTAADRRRLLAEALRRLSPAQRRVTVLAYFGELTQREIAERGRLPLGTVKTRTCLALRRLRGELEAPLR